MMKSFSVSIVSIYLFCSTYAYAADLRVVRVENYRVIAGKTVTDREAVDTAVKEAIAQSATYNVRLVFQADRTYRLKRKLEGQAPDAIFPFTGVKNIMVNGNNAQILLDRYDYVAEIRDSENIHIWNLRVDYAVPNHTQGRVVAVDPSGNFITVDIDAGYLMPNKGNGSHEWANSLSFDSQEKYLKNVNVYIEDVQIVGAKRVKIITKDGYQTEAKKLHAGYKFAFRAFGEGGKTNFHILQSKNVSFKNVDVYNTMKIAFTARYNEGNLLFDHVRVMRKPNSNRLIAGLSDSFHMKSNRAIVTIRNSLVERTLDDGINLGSMAEVCHSYNPNTLELELRDTGYISKDVPTSAPLKAGDTLSAFQLGADATKIFIGSAKIASVNSITNKMRRVRLTNNIPGIRCLDAGTGVGLGGKFLEQWHATRFFSPEVSNPGFRVLNNTIREKTRNGILGKAQGSMIRGNHFENISGNGIDATNNLMFNEGPVAMRMEISANTFKDIFLYPVILGVSSYSAANLPTLNINSNIVNNDFIGGKPIRLMNATHINIAGNFFSEAGSSIPIKKNISDLTSNSATAIFRLGSAYYYEGPTYICRYDSEEKAAQVWGQNFQQFAASRTQFPPARYYLGSCQDSEGSMRLANSLGLINKTRLSTEACGWGTVRRFQLGTGIADPRLMNFVNSSIPISGICKF
ncbi:MAG: right-handed parallel beta-helix repeat-containing protein [Oligoflexia bacterium]|nr:right-handed parallel beta-helix repeat-containing protein [Oligoflexia bacterium]